MSHLGAARVVAGEYVLRVRPRHFRKHTQSALGEGQNVGDPGLGGGDTPEALLEIEVAPLGRTCLVGSCRRVQDERQQVLDRGSVRCRGNGAQLVVAENPLTWLFRCDLEACARGSNQDVLLDGPGEERRRVWSVRFAATS